MYTVAVTGNAASGKSAFCGFLAERGAPVVSADAINQGLLRQSRFLAAWLGKIFPQTVTTADGSLDKARLRSYVFERPELRKKLEAVLHPVIRENIELRRAIAPRAPYVVVEIPLLFETAAAYHDIDHIILVTADRARLLQRIAARPGLDINQADAILRTQRPDESKFALCDAIVINNGGLEELREVARKARRHIKAASVASTRS